MSATVAIAKLSLSLGAHKKGGTMMLSKKTLDMLSNLCFVLGFVSILGRFDLYVVDYQRRWIDRGSGSR